MFVMRVTVVVCAPRAVWQHSRLLPTQVCDAGKCLHLQPKILQDMEGTKGVPAESHCSPLESAGAKPLIILCIITWSNCSLMMAKRKSRLPCMNRTAAAPSLRGDFSLRLSLSSHSFLRQGNSAVTATRTCQSRFCLMLHWTARRVVSL